MAYLKHPSFHLGTAIHKLDIVVMTCVEVLLYRNGGNDKTAEIYIYEVLLLS